MSTSDQVEIAIWRADAPSLAGDLAMLARVLHACVHAGASVNFILPFSIDDARAFWRDKVVPAVLAGSCRVLVARIEGQIVGTVQLDLATPPNQPHRAEARKLLVHPEARRRGIARSLMIALEAHAREAGRTLVTLDTMTESFAEPLYRSLGYVPIGIVPGYSLQPDRTSLEPATFMYKNLAPQ